MLIFDVKKFYVDLGMLAAFKQIQNMEESKKYTKWINNFFV